MSFTSLLDALMRRWYIVLVGVVLTGALGWGAAMITPVEYSARGLVMLVPPPSEEEGVNPFLNLGGLDIPARVLATYFTSDSAQMEIQQRSPEAEVGVSIDESTRGPVIAIDVIDTSPSGALDVLDFVAGEIPVVLARLQSEVGATDDIAVRSMPLTMDFEAEPDYTSLTRIVIATVVAGLAATALIAFAVDGLVQRRTATRGSRRSAVGDDSQEPSEEDEVSAAETETPAPQLGLVPSGPGDSDEVAIPAPASRLARR